MKQILVEIKKCLGCRSCEIACAVGHSVSQNLFVALIEGEELKKRVFVEQGAGISFPVQCRHCEEPACQKACMAGALHRDAVTGVVEHNPDKCVGCWMCIMVCPFGALSQDKPEKVIVKCDRCSDIDEPRCVNACPTKAIKFEPIDSYIKDKRQKYLQNICNHEEGN